MRLPDCSNCGARPGTVHQDGCDIERCSVCGGQRMVCLWTGTCRDHDKAFARWTGLYRGAAEADALGMDLNQLILDGTYRAFFVKPT